MNALRQWWRIVTLFCLLATGPAAQAQIFSKPTLEKIREYGAIYVGHREASVPFSYFVGDEVVGYSMDLCHRIVDAIRHELDDPTLKVVLVPVTSSSRLLMLMTGVIDLECGSTTNTKIRQQSVAFGVTTFVSGVKAVVRKDVGIERLVDLSSRVIVTTAGTTTDRVVKTVLASHKILAHAKSARTHSESLSMVLSRQADAFVLDDAILAGLLANSPDGQKMKLLEENFGFEPYGIALRKDDPEFKKLVDSSLIRLMGNGELEKLYTKWFMSPIPPKGARLEIPMSGMLRDLLRSPNDTGI
jgi:glutamate/aspartate transport system substrate-binding protein